MARRTLTLLGIRLRRSKVLNLLIIAAILFGGLAGVMSNANPQPADADSFDDDNGAWNYVGSAHRDENGKNVILTGGSVINQAGVLWLKQDLRTQFNASFRFKAGGGTGGEGFAFMFYKNKEYAPSAGESLAFGNTAGYAVEFDSLDNGESDPSENHIALIEGHSGNHITSVDDDRTEDNQWHWVEVDVRPFVVVVRIDSIVALEWAGALDTTYGGIGFCASTGSSANCHLVDDVKVRINDAFTEDTELWDYDGSPGTTAYRDDTSQNVVLTKSRPDQAGLMRLNQDITSPFATTFEYQAGGGLGSEGMAFMFYKNTDYLPGTGGTLGFNPTDGTASGYGIEFDSSPGEGDPDGVGNHIALIKDSSDNHLAWADSRIWRRMDSGTLNDLYSIWGAHSGAAIAVGQRGTIARYDGATWKEVDNVTTQNLFGVCGTDDGADIFAVGHNGTVLHYSDNPGVWESVDSVTTQDLRAVWVASSCDVYAAGSEGTLVHFDGVSWTTFTGLPDQNLRGIWGSSSADVFAVGDSGVILHYDGSVWSAMSSGVTDNLSSIWGTASDDVFAVGTGGRILRYNGTAWTTLAGASTADLYSVWGSGPTDVLAVGAKGTVQRFDGATWNSMQNIENADAHGVWATSPGNVFVAGWGGSITRYADVLEDGQWHWVRVYAGKDKLEVIVDDCPGVLTWHGELDRGHGGIGFCAASSSSPAEQKIDDVSISLPDCGVRNLRDFVEYITKGKMPTAPEEYDGYVYVMDSAYSPESDGVLPEGSLNLAFNWDEEWTWDLGNTTLWEGEYKKGPVRADLAITIPQGTFTFKPEMHVGCRTEGWHPESAEATVRGTASLDLDVRAGFNAGSSDSPSAPINETFERNVFKFKKTFGQMASFVPVWETVEMTVYVGCEVRDSSFGAWLQTGVSSEASVQVGAGYDSESGFSALNDASFDFNVKPLTWQMNGKLWIRPYAGVRFKVNMYSVIGPTFGVEPYMILDGNLRGASSAPISYDYNIDAGVRLEGGISMPMFGERGNWTTSKDFPLPNHLVTAEGHGPKRPQAPRLISPPNPPYRMGTCYTFSALSEDDDLDRIQYVFDWGDDTTTETMPVDSGAPAKSTHSWRLPGAYQVRVRAKDGKGWLSEWSDALAVTVVDLAPLIPGVEIWDVRNNREVKPATECLVASKVYEFRATATDPDVTAEQLTYYFNWGNGAGSTMGPIASGITATATHAWPKAGAGSKTYTVTIKVQDQHGLESPLRSLEVTVADCPPLGKPDTPTGPNTNAVGETCVFWSRLDNDVDGNPLDDVSLRFIFEWGDGQVTEVESVSHVTTSASHEWCEPGVYSIRVHAALIGGPENVSPCSDNAQITVINSPPVIQYVVSPEDTRATSAGVACTYRVSATDPNRNDLITYLFDWGDGKTCSTESRAPGQETSSTHAWDTDGLYTLRIWAIDNHGYASDHWAVRIVVNTAPVASFRLCQLNQYTDNSTQTWTRLPGSSVMVTTGNTLQFTDNSTDTMPGRIVRRQWDLGDGTSLEDTTQVWHRYLDDGYYIAALTVWDDIGMSSQFSVRVIVCNVPPQAEFVSHPVSLTERDTIQFLGRMSTDSDGSVKYWEWDFGDGSGIPKTDNPALFNPIHHYDKGAIYMVKLTIWDDDEGCSHVRKKTSAYPLAYHEDFEDDLAGEWSSHTNAMGLSVNQRSTSSASQGVSSWLMSIPTGTAGENELVLHIYVIEASQLNLAFAAKALQNDHIVMPEVFKDDCAGDGVAVSNDGEHWRTLWSYSGHDDAWDRVDPLSLSIGDEVGLDGHVFIKFQDYEQNAKPNHKMMWDDICLISDGVVVPVPCGAKTLSAGAVTPLSGADGDTYVYEVTYTDARGYAPSESCVIVDGIPQPMDFVGGSHATGALYRYSTTLTTGEHSYQFLFSSDGVVETLPASGECTGPSVGNLPPTLSAGSVAPSNGDVSSAFQYEVTYTDRESAAPSLASICIDGTAFPMTHVGGGYGSGALYRYSTSLDHGVHEFRFEFSDGAWGTTSPTFNHTVADAPPLLLGAGVTGGETENTTHLYEVTYIDPGDDPPTSAEVCIDGVAHTMQQASINGSYAGGALFQFSTRLSSGTHEYYFRFSDGIHTVNLPTSGAYSGPSVINTPPSLRWGAVSPVSGGDEETAFVYEVTYSDPGGDPPSSAIVWIDNIPCIMSFVGGSFDGAALYRFSTKLGEGDHSYYFSFADEAATVNTDVFVGPSVADAPPVLSSGSVTPVHGGAGAEFTFTVTYGDIDDAPAALAYVYLDSNGTFTRYAMTRENGNRVTGVPYRLCMTLQEGTFDHYFGFSDNISDSFFPNRGTSHGPGIAAVISSDTTLCAGTHTYGDIVITNGALLILDGSHLVARDIIVYSGSSISSLGARITARNVTIEEGASISANGAGYAAGSGPGGGTAGSGGGYAGLGGSSSAGSAAGEAYGSPTTPTELGSGGGNAFGAPGGAGGGIIRLDVSRTLTIDGCISADGADGGALADGSGSHGGGGGSGGSVLINAARLSGSGTVSANGGNGGKPGYSRLGGGGGGGRVAITHTTSAYVGEILACGGLGHECGGAGTALTKSPGQSGHLVMSNNGFPGAATPVVGSLHLDTVSAKNQADVVVESSASLSTGSVYVASARLTNKGKLDCPALGSGAGDFINSGIARADTLYLTNLIIQSGGTLTHGAGRTLNVTVANDLAVDAGGSINVNGMGYGTGAGPGKGIYRGGGGYGGVGGEGNMIGSQGGNVYGSVTEPIDLGSGGSGSIGSGGGAVRLRVTGILTVNGSISANGSDGAAYYGGGSGGSIWITAGSIAGVGAITANGGNGRFSNSSGGGGGGGGRIALYYTSNSHSGALSACGGTGCQNGGAGTIFHKSAIQAYGDLLIDNGDQPGSHTPIALGSAHLDNLTIRNGASATVPSAANVTVGTLSPVESASLTVETGSTLSTGTSCICVQSSGSLSIEAGAAFNPLSISLTSSHLAIQSGCALALVHLLTQSSTITNDGRLSWGNVCFRESADRNRLVNGGSIQAASLNLKNVNLVNDGSLDIDDNTITIGDSATLEQNEPLSLNNLVIQSGGVLSHGPGRTLNVTVTGDLDINAGGSIDVNGMGYGVGAGPGKGVYRGGGGYGGLGGQGSMIGSQGGNVYGSVTEPIDLGSGGSGSLGSGGGAVRLKVTGILTVNGSISANGSDGAAYCAGGSGGSIWITAGSIAGAGAITANGGNGRFNDSSGGGGGGGGRIALYYTSNSHSGALSTGGGTGYQDGGAGTLYLESIPVLNSISPSSGMPGQSLSVSVNGAYLSSSTSVTFGEGITVDSFVTSSDSQLTANITIGNDAAVGSRCVSVTNGTGTGLVSGGFAVATPLTAAFSATPLTGDAPLTVAFTDMSTTCGEIASRLWNFGDGQTSTEQNPSHTYAMSGVYTVTLNVTDADGVSDTVTKEGCINVIQPPPTVTTVSPTSGIQGQSLDVTITGAHLAAATTVDFGSGIVVNSFILNSDTQITASITIDGSAAVGSRIVSVTSPGGIGSATPGFTVKLAAPNGWYERYASSNARSGVTSSAWLSQSFTPATSHQMNTVSLCLYKSGSPDYSVTVSVHFAGADDRPAGPALCSAVFPASSLTTAATWYEYRLSTGYDVMAGTKYALVLSAASGSLQDLVYWRVDKAGTYGRGMRASSANQGASWTTNPAQDFTFKEGQSPPKWHEQSTAWNARSGVISSFWLSQSFTPVTSHNLNTVSFYLHRVGTPTYTVTVGLYLASADNIPMGTALSSTTFQASSVTTSAKWYEYRMNGCQVTAGIRYALVLSASEGTADNCVYLGANTTGTYARGMRAISNNQGTTWTVCSSQDFTFKEGQNPPAWHEQYATGPNAASGVTNGFWLSQTFTPVRTHTLNTVSLCLYKAGGPDYTVTISLYLAGAEDKPTGAPLCSTTFEAWSLTTTATWDMYQFSTGYQVKAGTKYALVLSAGAGTAGNMVYWRVKTAGTYSRGARACSRDQGVTWTVQPAMDFMFREGQS